MAQREPDGSDGHPDRRMTKYRLIFTDFKLAEGISDAVTPAEMVEGRGAFAFDFKFVPFPFFKFSNVVIPCYYLDGEIELAKDIAFRSDRGSNMPYVCEGDRERKAFERTLDYLANLWKTGDIEMREGVITSDERYRFTPEFLENRERGLKAFGARRVDTVYLPGDVHPTERNHIKRGQRYRRGRGTSSEEVN